MQIGISRRDSGVRRNSKFYFPNFQFLPFRCKSESPAARHFLPFRCKSESPPPPRLAPDICRGRNEYGGVYSAPPPPDSRRRIPASPAVIPANAGICKNEGRRKKNLPFPRTRESVRIALRCKLPPLYSAPPPLFLAAEFPPPRRHSGERGNPFLPTNPRIPLAFCKKMCGNSKLNFRVKFAGIPKLISPNRFPLSRE